LGGNTMPDWLIALLARLGGPLRVIVEDIGNEKHFTRDKAEGLLGRSLISGHDAVLASASTLLALPQIPVRR
jgi:dihydroflavonol-4-reductase